MTTRHHPAHRCPNLAPAPTDQEVQAYLRTGLRNRWWPILPSRFVETGGKPVGLTRLGEPLMLWRDTAAPSMSRPIAVRTARCRCRAASTRAIGALRISRRRGRAGRHGPRGSRSTRLPARRQESRQDLPLVRGRRRGVRLVRRRVHEEPAPFEPPEQLSVQEYSHSSAMPIGTCSGAIPTTISWIRCTERSCTRTRIRCSRAIPRAHFVTRDTPRGYHFREGRSAQCEFRLERAGR